MIKAILFFSCFVAFVAMASADYANQGTVVIPATGAAAAVTTTAVQPQQSVVTAAAIPIVCPAGCIPSNGAGGQSSSSHISVLAAIPVMIGGAALALL